MASDVKNLQPYAVAVTDAQASAGSVLIVLATPDQMARLAAHGVMALHVGGAHPVQTVAEQAEIIKAMHDKAELLAGGGSVQ